MEPVLVITTSDGRTIELHADSRIVSDGERVTITEPTGSSMPIVWSARLGEVTSYQCDPIGEWKVDPTSHIHTWKSAGLPVVEKCECGARRTFCGRLGWVIDEPIPTYRTVDPVTAVELPSYVYELDPDKDNPEFMYTYKGYKP